MAKGKKEERKKEYVPIHEILINLLYENPEAHILTIAKVFSRRAKIPKEAAEGLARALRYASQETSTNVSLALVRIMEQEPKKEG